MCITMKCLLERILIASWYKVKGACHKIFHELSVLTGPDYLLRAISKEREHPSILGALYFISCQNGIKLGTYRLINANETEVER